MLYTYASTWFELERNRWGMWLYWRWKSAFNNRPLWSTWFNRKSPLHRGDCSLSSCILGFIDKGAKFVYTGGKFSFIAKAFSSTVGVIGLSLWEFDRHFTLVLGSGSWKQVLLSANSAAACWAFLILCPDALYCSSPTGYKIFKMEISNNILKTF